MVTEAKDVVEPAKNFGGFDIEEGIQPPQALTRCLYMEPIPVPLDDCRQPRWIDRTYSRFSYRTSTPI